MQEKNVTLEENTKINQDLFEKTAKEYIEDNKPIMLEGFVVGKNKLLEQTPRKFDMENEEDVNLIKELILIASDYNLMSLSACQIGVPIQAFVIKDWETYRAYLNPRVVYESPELAMGTEHDISFPGLAVKVTRPYSIRVRYTDVYGAVQTATLEGGTARLFQHEMTHMNGTYFFDDANFNNRNKALKDWKAIQRKIKKHG